MLIQDIVWSLIVFGELVLFVSSETLSQNVSEGQTAEFTCVSTNSYTIITWITTPNVGSVTPINSNPPSGGRRSVLRFVALANNNHTTVACIITDTKTSTFITHQGKLLVQGPLSGVGNLTSSKVDHCTLHFTWTAPYTLQGVPIKYYTINITRHSDGAVLTSDTTNTTEYLYTVSSLGETLEVAVAAVNGAGTGNMSVISISIISNEQLIPLVSGKVVRKSKYWTYTCYFMEVLKCKMAIDRIIVEACLSSSCVNVTGLMNISADGVRRVMATFTNLEENRKYSASVHVQYNGGVVQHSQPVEISTFDIYNVSVTMLKLHLLCFTIEYIDGYKTPYTFLRLFCPTIDYVQNQVIDGTDGCISIQSVNSTQTCNLSATDIDAISNIDTTPAVVITVTLTPESTSTSYLPNVRISSTPTLLPTGISNAEKIGIAAAIVTSQTIVTIVVTTLVLVTCFILYQKRVCCKRITRTTAAMECITAATCSPPSDPYEKVDSQFQTSVPMMPVYDEIQLPVLPTFQKNIDTNLCPAYGVEKRKYY